MQKQESKTSIGNGNSANLLARVGNQSARGRKYNFTNLIPFVRSKWYVGSLV